MNSARGDVTVIGGGLAGLTAAIVAARRGARVTIVEARSELGGRARSSDHGGFVRNEGPRALYLAGEALRVLKDLGVAPTGGAPVLAGVALRADGSEGELPLGAASLARTKLLGTRAKAELIGAMGRMATTNVEAQRGLSFARWLDEHTTRTDVRLVLEMLARLGTYAADLDAMSAEAVLAQSRLGAKGVLYVDGGWRQLVSALAGAANAAGVSIVGGESVIGVAPKAAGNGWTVRTADREFDSATVIAAGLGAPQLDRLLGEGSRTIADWAQTSRPAMAACLDVCLELIPEPSRRFDLGLDRPWYVSFHTPGAKLSSGSGEVVHVMKYVPQAEEGRSPVEDRAELEAVLDRAQPGWRDVVVHSRYLHRMAATHHVPGPGASVVGRCPVMIADSPGLFVAGDWVGPHGLLVDGSVVSAVNAGEQVMAALAAA